MATPPTLVHLPFGAGIDESTRAELADPQRGFLALENVRQTKRGALYKRAGFDALTRVDLSNTTITAGRRLYASPLTGAPIMCSGRLLHEYSENATAWTNGVPMSEWTVTEKPVASTGVDTTAEDVTVCNGFVAVASVEQDANAYASVAVYDANTFAVVRPPEELQAEAGYILLAHYSSRYIIAFYFETSNNTIAAWYLDTNTATTINTGWVSIGDLTTAWNHGGGAVCSMGDRCGLAYDNTTAGTDQVTIRTVNISGSVETSTVNTNSVTPTSVACDGASGGTFWVSWNESTAVRVRGFNPTDLTTTTASVATICTVTTSVGEIFVKGDGSTSGMLFAQNTGASTMQLQARKFITSGGVTTASGSEVTVFSAWADGYPFYANSRYHIAMQPPGSSVGTADQNVLVYCDVDNVQSDPMCLPVAHIQNSLVPISQWRRRKVELLSGTTYITCATVKKNNLTARATHLVCLESVNAARQTGLVYGGSLVMTGGVLQSFDGVRVAECGFLARPPKPSVTESAGSLSPTVGYRWVVVYEEVDANGNVHVSGVSDPSDLSSTTASRQYTVTVGSLIITGRHAAETSTLTDLPSTRIVLYRTKDGGSVYYRVSDDAVNNKSGGSQTITDNTADASLGAALYRHPGVVGTALDRRAFPHAADAVEYNNMLVVATESSIQHSGQLVSGEAPWTNPIFEVPIPGPGRVTALASQDGSLYAFKRRELWVVTGTPPSDNGTSGGFGRPRRLAVDVGCIDPRSVVTTSLGVFFQSERGIELLTRAQAVEHVGEPIQTTLGTYGICTAATLDPANSLVRFDLGASESSNVIDGNGVSVVYDLDARVWASVDKRTNAAATTLKPPQDAAMVYVSGAWKYAWLDSGAYVNTEASHNKDADGSYVQMSATTAWLKAGGLQGKQIVNKVLVLAQKTTDHDLDAQLAYDFGSYETARSYTHTETAAVVAAVTNEQLQLEPHDKRDCMAVSVKLTDKTPTSGTVGNGTGAVWIGLTFDITQRPGAALTYDGSR